MKNTLKFLFFVLLSSFILMLDAFYNGFPIVYSDTSTYIAYGLELETPFDRPITYGLFLRVFSLNGLSLWFVIFFQALILSYLIFLVIKVVTDDRSFLKLGLLTIIFLALFTSISWTVSQLMPDIFTSIALLCTTLILLGKFERKTLILLYVLFSISVAMHLSHILLFGLILISILCFRKFILPKVTYPKRNLHLTVMLLLTSFSILTMNKAFAKSKHVFFMGALVEHGIVKSYLNDYCETEHYKLCAYKDSLPKHGYEFLWDEKGPLYKVGGWEGSKDEFNAIIYGTLTKPKYIAMHVKESVKATLQQLTLFAIGDGNGSFLEGTFLHFRVSKYFPHDLMSYTSSKQNQFRLDYLNLFNTIFLYTIVLSLLLSLFLGVLFFKNLNRTITIIVLIFLFGLLLNAWDCGTFANAIDRLGSKMSWIVPFITVLLLWHILHTRSIKKY